MTQSIDIHSGQAITGINHLQQSIADILTTPIGTRVRRRDYGSDLFELIDAPMTDNNIIEVYAATAVALRKWEPRLQLNRVQAYLGDETGKFTLLLDGSVNAEDVQLEVQL